MQMVKPFFLQNFFCIFLLYVKHNSLKISEGSGNPVSRNTPKFYNNYRTKTLFIFDTWWRFAAEAPVGAAKMSPKGATVRVLSGQVPLLLPPHLQG
jgi:hypothetical protein